ncbi:class I SAM-dependent methyltransferase [Streptomyces sp. MI02-7b]|uniref:class I SAM-dependent methyltransferase n=1 Tax=Streptomyces sp. MI02-7b TaxID=462941 RepID=UPI0029BA5091|nr:class I SAM-dependent methyltransferase [Streptomyces sp. MI02-7b]MDX3075789.1 class I SAM-dependent methyltransferase [Streptomyces sp. MI02-7b]
MTYLDDAVPNPCGDQVELFAAAAAGYDRYRPGAPAEAARLLADTLADLPDPTLLDLGTGTGQAPKALLKALPSLAHIEGVDWSRQMLDQARAALTPVLGSSTLSLVQTSADVYAPLAPLRGEEWWTPDLITCCRAFHWMSGPDVLAMAHRIAAPRASLAIMGDGSLCTYDADWTGALRDLIQGYLGPGRRAGALGEYPKPMRPFQQELADSAWSDVSEHRCPLTRSWTPESVLGYLRTTSFAGADLFADRHAAFEAEARGLLDDLADGGSLLEETEFTVLLARRPAGAR